MSHFSKAITSVASTAVLCSAIYLSTTQPSLAEVDCKRPSKTKFEEYTCVTRWKAGLEKAPPPGYRRLVVSSSKRTRTPVARTWEEREKQARAFCDATGNALVCSNYWGWLANNPRSKR